MQHYTSEALFQAEGRVVVYDNVFINSGGDAIRIQPHNDVPRDMMIFSNTVLASGAGIAVRQSEGASYRQRVLANVVAAAVPVSGGEQAHNVTLGYRPEWAAVPVLDLTARLLSASRSAGALPASLVGELRAYPGWQVSSRPGATLAPSRLPTPVSVLP